MQVFSIWESDGYQEWMKGNLYATRELAEANLPKDTYFESYEIKEHVVEGAI